MQTFLPYPSFQKSAKCLDNKRLGKQRVECLQILRVLTGKTKGWKNHPAVKMWRGHEWWLMRYADEICYEWANRGFKDTCWGKIWKLVRSDWLLQAPPPWLGNRKLHLAYRSNLVRKDPKHYKPLFGNIPNDLEYVWPV